MPFALPDADCIHPLILPDGQPHLGTVFLRNVIDQDNFTVGAYSYASDFDPPPVDGWATRLAPYLFPGAPGAIRIGKFCQIAQGARFISAAANHAADGLSTFPFRAFDPALRLGYHPDRRDTEVGHDVWIGMDAKILSGARIGTGAIIGAGSVVRGDVPPFAVVIGNPGRVIRMRFAADSITALLDLAWWDWPAAVISAHHDRIVAADIAALAAVAP